MQAPTVSFSVIPGKDQRRSPGARHLVPLAPTLRRSAWRSLATAALLVVTLLGAYFAILVPNDANERPPLASAPARTVPGATPTLAERCETTDWYFGCSVLIQLVGHNFINLPGIDEPDRDVRQVQLQGWAIAPGASLVGADAGDAARGVVVDVVLAGAYVATFDVPVIVSPGGVTNEVIQYLDAGAMVELVRGDSVSYQLGGLVEVHNPLSGQRVELKRAVIYEGDVSTFSATAEGVTTRVETDGVLPLPLGEYELYGNEVMVELWYLQVHEESYPPPYWQSEATLLLGPVDPQRGPAGTEGFVLVIQESAGG